MSYKEVSSISCEIPKTNTRALPLENWTILRDVGRKWDIRVPLPEEPSSDLWLWPWLNCRCRDECLGLSADDLSLTQRSIRPGKQSIQIKSFNSLSLQWLLDNDRITNRAISLVSAHWCKMSEWWTINMIMISKGNFIKPAIRPGMKYGSECWTSKYEYEQKMTCIGDICWIEIRNSLSQIKSGIKAYLLVAVVRLWALMMIHNK